LSTFRGFEHELGPLPGVAGFLAFQQRAALVDLDGSEAVPGDAQHKGSFVLVAAPDRQCAVCWDFLSNPVSTKSQEGHSTPFRSANKLRRELRRPLWTP
jgi:hypothetical protein